MSTKQCPLPEVEEALRAYIRPRHEVTAIRQGLQDSLSCGLQSRNAKLSYVDLSNSDLEPTGSLPKALTGLRKAYCNALQAHKDALNKYNALKADIDSLKDDRAPVGFTSSSASSEIVQDEFLPLIRQREKQRKAEVIDKALTTIISTGEKHGVTSFDDLIRREIGDLPVPPSSQLPTFDNHNAGVEATLLELKKAIIASKRRLDQQNGRLALDRAIADSQATEFSDLPGLQKALQELTVWMEAQLAVIAGAEPQSNKKPQKQSVTNGKQNGNGGPVELTSMSQNYMDELYQDYRSARERLIQTVANLSEQSNAQSTDLDDVVKLRKDAATNGIAGKTASETLLPFVSGLMGKKHQEQSLMRQIAYIRKELSLSEADTTRVIRRLAEESHMVMPGTSHGKDWLKAAIELNRDLETSAHARLILGKADALETTKTLDELNALVDRFRDLAA